MSGIPDGRYTYRFSGFARDSGAIENFLAGVGSLQVADGRVVEGEHRATYLRLRGGDSVPVHGRFHLMGDFSWNTVLLSGSAVLVFTQQDVSDDDRQRLWGQFALVQAGGPGRYWLISKDDTRVQVGNEPVEIAAEAVEGELVRIPG